MLNQKLALYAVLLEIGAWNGGRLFEGNSDAVLAWYLLVHAGASALLALAAILLLPGDTARPRLPVLLARPVRASDALSPTPSATAPKAEPKKTADQAWAERAKQVFTPNYAPAELVIDRGEGCYVWDLEGRRYLDFTSAQGVAMPGHRHPALRAGIAAQASKLLSGPNFF